MGLGVWAISTWHNIAQESYHGRNYLIHCCDFHQVNRKNYPVPVHVTN